jgi:flagellar hook-associated protein 2
LQVVVSGGVAGDRGTVNYSRGYATQLNDFVNAFSGSDGILASGTDGMSRSIKDLQSQEAAEQVTLTNKETALRAQFNALDTMMSQLTSTSSYLTQQLSMIAAQTPA